MDTLTRQYADILAADGARPLLAGLQGHVAQDILQIEKQLTAIYIDAKAARISAALDKCVSLCVCHCVCHRVCHWHLVVHTPTSCPHLKIIIWLLHNLVEASFDLFRYLLLGDQLKPWELHPLVSYTSSVTLNLL